MIKNSMDIEKIWLSEAYWNEVDSIDVIEKTSTPYYLPFDNNEN